MNSNDKICEMVSDLFGISLDDVTADKKLEDLKITLPRKRRIAEEIESLTDFNLSPDVWALWETVQDIITTWEGIK